MFHNKSRVFIYSRALLDNLLARFYIYNAGFPTIIVQRVGLLWGWLILL